MMTLAARAARFDKIVPAEQLNNATCHIFGCGAVGRIVAHQLAQMEVGHLHLYDDDVIGEENLGTQGWPISSIGLPKVDQLQRELRRNTEVTNIITHNQRVTPADFPIITTGDHLFLCVDSLDTRRAIAEAIDNWAIDLYDTRCGLETVEVYHFTSLPEFQEHTTTDGTAFRADCTTRQTPYTATLAAALVVNQFTRVLRDDDEVEVAIKLHGHCMLMQKP